MTNPATTALPLISGTEQQVARLVQLFETQSVGVYTRGLTGQWPVVMYSMWRQMIAGDKQ